MSRKLTYEFVKEQFEKEGYGLLGGRYINAHQKLDCICSNGHKCGICWNNWRTGKRCVYCSKSVKPTIEFIKSEFEKEGYKLLTATYINNRQKLEFVCPKGHKYSISWTKWQQNQRCYYCSKNIVPTIGFIKSEFEKEGYQFLTTIYIDSQSKLDYICPNGHKYNISWNSWQQGSRCFICAVIGRSGPNSSAWKGGIACEPYCPIWLEPEFKQMILKRDNYQCQSPDCWGTSKKLCGHHIDYNKKNCDPFNIITLCNSCNTRANKSREYWTNFYQKIMKKEE